MVWRHHSSCASCWLAILTILLWENRLLRGEVTTDGLASLHLRLDQRYNGPSQVPEPPSFVQEYYGSSEFGTSKLITVPLMSGNATASVSSSPTAGTLMATASFSASQDDLYYNQGFATGTASVSISGSSGIRKLTASRASGLGSVVFNNSGPFSFSVSASGSTVGTPGTGGAVGVIFWADQSAFLRGERPKDPVDGEMGNEPAEVAGAFGPQPQYRSDGTVLLGGPQFVSPISSYGNFNRFVAPIEDAFGHTAPIYVAREWSNSTDYLFRSVENSVTSIILPNPTQGGDSSFELSFGNINSPTTMTVQAGVGFDFTPFYASGVTWFSISDVTTNLNAPIDPLNPFVLGVTYASNGYSELKSWEVVAIPEPATATIMVLLAAAAITRIASKKCGRVR